MTIPRPIVAGVDFAFRVAVIAICLAAVDFSSISTGFDIFALAAVVALAAIYLLVATLLGRLRGNDQLEGQLENTGERQEKQRDLAKYLAHLDCLLLGLSLPLLPVNLAVIAMVATLVAVRAVAVGGAVRLPQHICLLVLGAVAAYGTFRPGLVLPPLEDNSLLALLFGAVFLVFVGWQMHRRQQSLEIATRRFNVSNLQLKLNNYKLAKYLSPSLRKAIFSGKRVTLETQRKRVCIFFSDIKGFSELSEELEADTLTSILNFYLTEMSDIALKFGGTVDKFIGDAIMVFFGDPVTQGAKEDSIACVSMAIAMQKRMTDLNKRWASQGIRKPLLVRMGINTGYCTVGNFGTENRLDYTLLGTEVNKASRLEAAAEAGEILISRQTYELIKDTVLCETRGYRHLKGFKDPVEVFAAVDLRANLGREDGLCVEHSAEGFSMFMDVESIPHLQKHRILTSLEEAYEQLRKNIETSTKDDVKIFK